LRNLTQVQDKFVDISKYYAARIVDNVLTVGKIIYRGDEYQFAREDVAGPFELVENQSDVTRIIHVIGEIHPRSAVEKYFKVDVNSCLYLNENEDSGEIEVRSIHKGMGTAIYMYQQCPLVLWNPHYEEHRYFDVIDIQNVFTEPGRKAAFTSMLSESLREYELFPPLFKMKK